ncbi:N-acetylmuramoyl-L-alanine amidase [Niabella aurantiaca]|uniref:N-acetylmuramoyl-L-alanine amidase n=1 Tax=Niabella aurantiaca TaxID=379900 RepID=UPI00036586E6|nr:N-acetylmuramoyl-L-alanine amidase [Niabella aurantiaca]
MSGSLLFCLLSVACRYGVVPKKTNVLDRKNISEKNNGPSKKQAQKDQTAFKIPKQQIRENEGKTTASSIKENINQKKTFEDQTIRLNPAALIYNSPQYFQYKADSLQKAYSRDDYSKNIQLIIDQISAIPNSTLNPALNTDKWYTAIDFNIRKPNFIVLHHTAQNNVEQTLFTFSLRRPSKESSAHYVISRDGSIYQMLNDYVRSWHAGASKWGNITDMNSCSLGIEIDNNGEDERYSDKQIEALMTLLSHLKEKYKIPQSNFIAHSDIAPGRKNDPSKYFPWKRLADAGFGFWYDRNNLKAPPSGFNALWALRMIGYDISNPTNAFISFKHHYVQTDDREDVLTEYDKKLIYNLALKYQ